ncbi:MAG: phosphoribosylformylglycinamidine cyclo-ligase [Actinomycetota bacterium]|nr:phosphoribosylformylglycinamidine cyclo-ligase [Actinomycetota bacterium]
MTDPPSGPPPGSSYAAAGVDIDAGERAVELMKSEVASASRPEVVGELGGFAGLFALDTSRYKQPLLASSTDGVGTKLAIAQAMDIHDTVGIDLVAMVVDDLVVCGAEPLFLLDYVATGKVRPERMAQIVRGIATGCRIAGCALIGGETAEHPGLQSDDAYDLAATGVGVVEADDLLGADRVRAGDVVVAMGSSGLHSNGFSLIRHVLLGAGRMRLDSVPDELSGEHGGGATLGEVLLTPTTIYARDCLAVLAEVEVHAFAHVTGGGLAANVARVVPHALSVTIDRSTWTPAPIFGLVAERGRVEPAEMDRTFNMGVGMVALVPAAEVDRTLATLMGRRVPAWVAGEVGAGDGSVRLTGAHPA